MKHFGDSENHFFDAIIDGVISHKSNGKTIDTDKIVQVLGRISTTICLKLRAISNQTGYFLDILTDVSLPIKFLPNIISSLNFLSDETCIGFLSKKGRRKKRGH